MPALGRVPCPADRSGYAKIGPVADTTWAALNRRQPRAGRLLVATPLIGDPHFMRTVVYLLEHDGGGTVGVIVNRPSHTPVEQVLPLWHEAMTDPAVVYGGGPVQPDGALCLARTLAPTSSMKALGSRIATVDLDSDVDEAVAAVSALRVFAGHSGWSPGQLDEEIRTGGWWVVEGSPDDLFSDEPADLWHRVLRRQRPPLNLLSTFPHDPSLN